MFTLVHIRYSRTVTDTLDDSPYAPHQHGTTWVSRFQGEPLSLRPVHRPCSVWTMLCVRPQTFPGDKENRVHFLLPSATPSPVHVTPHKDRSPHRGGEGSGTLQERKVGGRGGGGGGGGGKQRSPPKRKVLR